MIIFEALSALAGDCLLLRYDDKAGKRRTWLIDGGPRTGKSNDAPMNVLKQALLPRLKQIDPATPFPIDLGMVSHIDDDHINGLEKLTADLVNAKPHPGSVVFERFWFNAFNAIVGPTPAALGQSAAQVAAVLSSSDGGLLGLDSVDEHGIAVLQSVPQGIKLETNLESLGLAGNMPFGDLVMAQPGQIGIDIDDARVTVLGPLKSRLEKLRAAWLAALNKPTAAARKAALQELFPSAGEIDASVANLSSIVVLVEIDGRRLLLTGDARGDDIVAAWKSLGLSDAQRKLDILKIPHHGSFANNTEDFVKFFEARHYVFSADGLHENPDPPVLEGLVSLHHKRPMTLHFTNGEIRWKKPYKLEKNGESVQTIADAMPALKKAYPGPWTFKFRDPAKLSIQIELP